MPHGRMRKGDKEWEEWQGVKHGTEGDAVVRPKGSTKDAKPYPNTDWQSSQAGKGGEDCMQTKKRFEKPRRPGPTMRKISLIWYLILRSRTFLGTLGGDLLSRSSEGSE